MKLLAAALLALAGTAALAQNVGLQGMMGNRALIIVDGAPPRSVAPGESYKGVKVLSTLGDQAVVEIGGQRHTLRVGDSPASVGAAAASRGSRIVLTANSGGHFHTSGTINGHAVEFLVDTGATTIAMGIRDAERLRLDFRNAPRVRMSTANGIITTWRVKLDSVRVGDVEVFNVDALVLPNAMPTMLLGNSFLTRFQMRRENDQLVLERRF